MLPVRLPSAFLVAVRASTQVAGQFVAVTAERTGLTVNWSEQHVDEELSLKQLMLAAVQPVMCPTYVTYILLSGIQYLDI